MNAFSSQPRMNHKKIIIEDFEGEVGPLTERVENPNVY